jgi:bifunctional non-homologous end joining protein LigD
MPARANAKSKSAKAVNRQLEKYRSMRDFGITAEPRGAPNGEAGSEAAKGNPFVVQKHAARQLHYDFRLGWHDVLKSWAVAKGPSYFTGDKRLAVEVEDHPMEYGGFEGTIPRGQYGGGTVMIWDYGTWTPVEDAERGFADGNLKFELHGAKLKGKWALIRMKRNPARDRSDKNNWLLIKERDEYAQPENAPSVTELAPDSAVTDRTMEEIAENQDHVWDSRKGLRQPEEPRDKKSAKAPKTSAKSRRKRSASLDKLLQSAPEGAFPGFIPPQLAQQAAAAPNGDEWVHELKLDGYRIQIHIRTRNSEQGSRRSATLYTRKGLNWTVRMQDIAHAAADLDVDDAIIDGEVVVLDQQGKTSFAELQAAFQEGKKQQLTYFAFGLLHLNGRNLCELSLLERKSLLADLLDRSSTESSIRFSEHIKAPGEAVFASACKLGAEGIVSKVASATYTPGRANAWLKIKCVQEQEFVIGGFTPPAKGGHGVGALLLGYYEDGKLRYAGRSGTGFTAQTHRMLRNRLDALAQKTSSFAEVPREAQRDAQWVKPQLVAQVAFANWTADDLVRQAAFKGLREDKPPREVVRERPVDREQVPAARSKRPGASPKRADSEKPAKLPITHPGKIIDPDSGITKQDLAEYYLAVAEHMLPHVADRPLSIVRCPGGISKPCFFQKHIGMGGLPSGVNSVPVPNRKTGKIEEYLTLSTPEGLLGLAQLGVLEIHPWGSKNDDLEKPDRIIFDLDPDSRISWKTLASAATELRKRLKQMKLVSFLKSTGGKGLHVVIPIEPEHEWPTVKQFAHDVVLQMERDNPSLYITKMTKAERTNRIYLDYLRNDREATAIAPFSPRSRTGVPVAATLDWNELQDPERRLFRVSDFADWKARLRRDPWTEMKRSQQPLAF